MQEKRERGKRGSGEDRRLVRDVAMPQGEKLGSSHDQGAKRVASRALLSGLSASR